VTTRAPFTFVPPRRRSLLQKLLDRHPRENAPVAVNNLLAAARRPRDVSSEQIRQVCAEHRVDLHGRWQGRFERLYRDYLMFCLEDRQLTHEELADLTHLKTVLSIAPEAVAAIHEHVARQVYSLSVAEVLEDGVIDDEESAFLGRLQHELALSARAAHRIMDASLKRKRSD
jgi:hypothetical protein